MSGARLVAVVAVVVVAAVGAVGSVMVVGVPRARRVGVVVAAAAVGSKSNLFGVTLAGAFVPGEHGVEPARPLRVQA